MRTWALSPAILLSSLGSGSFLELHLEAECSRSLSLLMQPRLPDPLPVCFQSRMEHTPPTLMGPAKLPYTSLAPPGSHAHPWASHRGQVSTRLWLVQSETPALPRQQGLKDHGECPVGRKEWRPPWKAGEERCCSRAKVTDGPVKESKWTNDLPTVTL